MSEQIEVVAVMQAKPGHEAALEAAAKAAIAPTHAENGCIAYELHTDTAKVGKLAFIETWTSKAALDAHLQTPHLKTLIGQIEEHADGGVTIDVLKKIS